MLPQCQSRVEAVVPVLKILIASASSFSKNRTLSSSLPAGLEIDSEKVEANRLENTSSITNR